MVFLGERANPKWRKKAKKFIIYKIIINIQSFEWLTSEFLCDTINILIILRDLYFLVLMVLLLCKITINRRKNILRIVKNNSTFINGGHIYEETQIHP